MFFQASLCAEFVKQHKRRRFDFAALLAGLALGLVSACRSEPRRGNEEPATVFGATGCSAAGVVLDEAGRPLEGVLVLAQDGVRKYHIEVTTDELGRFEITDATESTLLIEPRPLGDRFAPRMMEVPAGSVGLCFRRTERAQRKFLNLRLVDAVSNARVDGAQLLLFETLGGFSVYGLDVVQEPFEFELPLRSGLRYQVRAAGYRSLEGEFDQISSLTEPTSETCLRLLSGFRETFRVVHAWSGAPLGGVDILVDGKLVGQTDAGGLATVDLDIFPEQLGFARCDLEPTECWTEFLNRYVNRNVEWRVSPTFRTIQMSPLDPEDARQP